MLQAQSYPVRDALNTSSSQTGATTRAPVQCASKEVKLFKNRRNQALRIPMDFAFDADTVRISRDGERLILEPVHNNALVALLDSWDALDEDFPVIDDAPCAPEDIL